MRRVHHAQGFSLVELLVAVLVLSMTCVAYLSLSSQETISAGAVRDRALASAMARNLVSVVRLLPSRRFFEIEGSSDGSGGYRLPMVAIPHHRLAMGSSFSEWLEGERAMVSLLWTPAPSVPSGGGPGTSLGRLTCTVQWKDRKDNVREVRQTAVLPR